jgi:hypothetical protein
MLGFVYGYITDLVVVTRPVKWRLKWVPLWPTIGASGSHRD